MTSAVPSSSTRHRGRRVALTGILAGALIAGGTVLATTVANPAGATPQFQEQGTLELKTRNNVTTAKLGTTTQTFTTSGQCQISSSGATLLRFSGQVGTGAGNVGFQSGTFGVAEKPSGTSCVEINNNKQTSAETLIVKLGGSAAFPLLANSATLDIEAKGTGAQTTVQFFRGGQSVGTNAIINCNATSSDSGPDAKNGDNCTETVTAGSGVLFDEIRLSASNGAAVSLEGGQDWVGVDSTVKTTFTVGYDAEPPVRCTTGSVSVSGSASTPAVTIRNISTSSGTCNEFVYSLTSTGGKATFLKPYTEQSERLQFMMDLEWQIANGAVAELPKIYFGFHDVNLVEGPAVELGWCANPVFNAAGLVTGLASAPTSAMEQASFPTYFNNPSYPGIQYACMGNPVLKRNPVTNQPVAWFQSIYVHGDAYARR